MRRSVKRRIWWGGVIAGLTLLAIMSAGLALLNRGSLPAMVTDVLVGQAEKLTGVRMQVKEAEFASPFRLVLRDVVIEPSAVGNDWFTLAGPLHIQQVWLYLNPGALWHRKWAESVERVELVAPVVTVALQQGNEEQVEQADKGSPAAPAGGSTAARRHISLPHLQVAVRDGSLLILQTGTTGTAPENAYTIWQEIEARGTLTPAGLQLQNLQATRDESKLTASGAVTAARWDLAIAATHLSLPADIPPVASWGVSGTADFQGGLSGALSQPELAGTVTIRMGTLWEQAIDSAAGEIRLSQQQFSFSDVTVRHGAARYELAGMVDDLSADPVRLDISLHSDHGRVEELLAVLALPVPARGELDGDIHFQGPVGRVAVKGDVQARQVTIYDEPLDSVDGRFAWSQDSLVLEQATAHRDQGRAEVAGRVDLLAKELGLDVKATNWPLAEVAHMPPAMAGLQGQISANGRLTGTLAAPRFSGRLQGSDISKGQLAISSIEGPVTWAGGTVSTTGMTAESRGGGSWWLQGSADIMATKPALDVTMRVEGESLSALLRMGGYRLPAMLVDGVVNGDIATTGALTNPDTHLRLYLSGAEKASDVLKLDMRISERRIKYLNLG